MTSKYLLLGLFIMAVLVVTSMTSLGAENRLRVYAVNYPLAYFAERIAGDHIDVRFPAPPDEDPAYWMPEKPVVSQYQKADLILLNGAGYAKWIKKVSLPRSGMVDTSKRFKDRYIYTKAAVTHSHGPEGEHAHENLAFTTWLDLSFAAAQAEAVANAIARKRPGLRDTVEENFKALETELLELDRRMSETVSSKPAIPLVVSHPVYDYLGQRYGLNLRSVHWEPHEKVGPDRIREIKNLQKDHPAAWMIWEGEPADGGVSKLASIGMGSVVFSPCGNRPDNGDFMSVMQENLENIRQIYE